jgi:hypothetical protein
MNKFFCLILALILAFALSACNSGTPKDVPADTPAGNPAQTPETSAVPANSPVPGEGDSEPPYWDGFDFGPNLEYREEFELLGDPGEYLNSAEGAKYTFNAVRETDYVPEYSDSTQYIMVFVGLDVIGGEECYVYRLDIDEPTGTLGAAYAYAYQSGGIYMEGYGGEFVPILGGGRGDLLPGEADDGGDGSWSDPGDLGASVGGRGDLLPGEASDPSDATWWGEYKTDAWSIGIVGYNGRGFRFEFYSLRDGHLITDGVAAVYPDNPLHAEYADFEFWLTPGFDTIQVFVTLGTEFDQLGGDYKRIEN